MWHRTSRNESEHPITLFVFPSNDTHFFLSTVTLNSFIARDHPSMPRITTKSQRYNRTRENVPFNKKTYDYAYEDNSFEYFSTTYTKFFLLHSTITVRFHILSPDLKWYDPNWKIIMIHIKRCPIYNEHPGATSHDGIKAQRLVVFLVQFQITIEGWRVHPQAPVELATQGRKCAECSPQCRW